MIRALFPFALVLALAVPAHAGALIPDGSFEDTSGGTSWTDSIAGWTLSPGGTGATERAGLFFLIDGLSPTEGSSFIGLTNNGGGAQTITSSTFTITRKELRFDYVYSTQTPGDTLNKDPFTVTLLTTGGGVSTVADSTTSGLGLGALGPSPFDGAPNYDSGWRTFQIDTSTLIGQTAAILFTLGDSGEGEGVSGVFLDNVNQIPEPGTLVLFGAGFLGLALFGRRRLRKR